VSGKLVKASNIIAPLLLRKADALIFVSRFSLKIFSKIFGQYLKRKSFVVYPSFDSSTADSVLSRTDLLSLKEKLFGNKIVIFSAGRLESRKGFDDLIISIIHVANKLPNVILVIAGPDAGHSSRLQSLANQLGLEGKVRFAGPLPEEQLLTYMMCSDVFVLPSLEDNLPVILLKALYIGKPVVATNVGGIPEIITHGKNGLLVEPANPEQLAAAILRIVCNPELAATLQTQAKDSIRKRFSYHNMVCDTLSVYRSLL
jgi:glycosyltransferase involved in cell wall biosynthesis